jgi:hypothetical protein
VRKLAGSFFLVMVAVACGEAVADAPVPQGPTHLQIRQTPSPFQQVSAGPVSTMIPDAWEPRLAGAFDDPRQGIVASPRPGGGWGLSRPPLEGLAAMWVDGSAVGVPSDYYYLAATGPALDAITGSELCRATQRFVVSNHLPAFARGEPDSPGDYVAHGQGTCSVGRQPARWAYFVAAPGFGPVRELGIPTSSLYVVVAVMPASPRAPFLLNRLLSKTEFNGASVEEMIAAASPQAN